VKTSAALLPLATFLILAAVAMMAGVPPGDPWLRDLILSNTSEPLVTIFEWINLAGSWEVLAPALLLLLLFPRARRCWWAWLALMILAPILEGLLKEVVSRPRPHGTAFGFPSGHATAAAAYFGALIYAAGDLPATARRLVRAGAVVMILLVALARIILRAHWPSDVVGGIALGLTCVTAAALISSSTARLPAGPRCPGPPSRAAPSRTPSEPA
jgi:membrane-associated phospholipid phosphatase